MDEKPSVGMSIVTGMARSEVREIHGAEVGGKSSVDMVNILNLLYSLYRV